jgi:hypothetical protein
LQRAGPEGLPPHLYERPPLNVEPGWDALAEVLAARLHDVAPGGFSVRPGPNRIELRGAGEPAWEIHFLKLNEDDELEDHGTLARACEGVLDLFQDRGAEETTEPWPAREGLMPMPGVEVGDEEIRLWYGDRRSPALTLEPIRRETLR